MDWQVLETDPETTSTLSPEPDFPPTFNWHTSENKTIHCLKAGVLLLCREDAGAESKIPRGMHGGPHAPQLEHRECRIHSWHKLHLDPVCSSCPASFRVPRNFEQHFVGISLISLC